tara:strand:- start:222 stop:470 length:249 start_codon:yes stop_codon:yes gene_type:complete
MGFRIVYKDGKEFVCGYTQASKLVETQGWSWTATSIELKPKKKTAKAKKVKVEADAEIKPGSTFDDGEPLNTDFDTNKQENE